MDSSVATIVSVNISEEKGTSKTPVEEVKIDDFGIVGDSHAGPWQRQVSLLSQECIEGFSGESERKFLPGEFAENLTTSGIDLGKVAVLDRLKIGEVVLEVTQVGKHCHGDGCSIFREVGRCVMPKEGLFTRVLQGGQVKPGDQIAHESRPLRFWLLCVGPKSDSEKADSAGQIQNQLSEFLKATRWTTEYEISEVADDPEHLDRELQRIQDARPDVIITIGGISPKPRDVIPEVVIMRCSKLVPGVMELIRTKLGARNPDILISRGIAGQMGHSLIYTVPGDAGAAGQFIEEILLTMEQLILAIHGLDFKV